jgi:hypothetical protein
MSEFKKPANPPRKSSFFQPISSQRRNEEKRKNNEADMNQYDFDDSVFEDIDFAKIDELTRSPPKGNVKKIGK